MKTVVIPFIATLLVAGHATHAADRADLEGTQIRGNRELPKVLYIVPWKQPEVGDLVGRPVQSLLDEALAPLDRDVFQRQVQYYGLIQATRPARPARVPELKTE